MAMYRIIVLFFLAAGNAYAGDAYYTCLNGCTFGANIGNNIAKMQDRYNDIKPSEQIEHDCMLQCNQSQANANQYSPPPTTVCRPDGFGNYRCQ